MAVVSRQTELRCAHCGFHRTRNHPRRFGENGICFERAGKLPDWFGEVVRVPATRPRCGRCGSLVDVPKDRSWIANVSGALETDFEGRCPACQEALSLRILRVPFHDASCAIEPFFGTRLFLVEETAKGELWAFSRAHAQAILDYIKAGDRTGALADGRGVFVENLPSWVQSAKNRETVIKAIERMLAK
jgi:DNA-directed RNA polymerase subunit RPC12/RpoP